MDGLRHKKEDKTTFQSQGFKKKKKNSLPLCEHKGLIVRENYDQRDLNMLVMSVITW